MRDKLERNIIVLRYDKTYQKETSAVAIVDDEGCLRAVYKFKSKHVYENHCTCRSSSESIFGRSFCTLPAVELTNSGGLWDTGAGRSAQNAWKFQTPTLEWECNVHNTDALEYFNVAQPNYELFHLFQGRLFPIEVAAVLMHALSSDARTIHDYVTAVRDNFDDFMCFYNSVNSYFFFDDYSPETRSAVEDWGRDLKQIKYDIPPKKDENSKCKPRTVF
jgi:hypothetical protein